MAERKQIKMTPQQLMQTFAGENERLEEVNRKINATFMALQEINMAIVAMEALRKAGGKEKMLVPLGAGAFLHATVGDKENVLFSMAGGILKTRKNTDVKKDLESRRAALEKTLEKARQEQARHSENANMLAKVLREGQRLARQRKAK